MVEAEPGSADRAGHRATLSEFFLRRAREEAHDGPARGCISLPDVLDIVANDGLEELLRDVVRDKLMSTPPAMWSCGSRNCAKAASSPNSRATRRVDRSLWVVTMTAYVTVTSAIEAVRVLNKHP